MHIIVCVTNSHCTIYLRCNYRILRRCLIVIPSWWILQSWSWFISVRMSLQCQWHEDRQSNITGYSRARRSSGNSSTGHNSRWCKCPGCCAEILCASLKCSHSRVEVVLKSYQALNFNKRYISGSCARPIKEFVPFLRIIGHVCLNFVRYMFVVWRKSWPLFAPRCSTFDFAVCGSV
jgi:hypothetical protein